MARTRRTVVINFCLLVLPAWAASLTPTAAFAQADGRDTIVVTARREKETLSDVPLDVKAVRIDSIGAGGIDGLQSLAASVPGLSFEAIWGGANSFPVLRGQSQPSAAGDNVGMFVDGVYQASRDALDVEPLDLERIEVVEGPQSALFGHSSFAGLISYVSAQASETWLTRGSLDVGTNALVGGSAVISGPIDGAWKMRVAGSWREAKGTWSNATDPGARLGNLHRLAVAATIATRDGSGPLSLRLSARYGENRFGQPPFVAVDYGQFNCGSRNSASGVWTYYCGTAPLPGLPATSPGIPDSQSWTAQVALHATLDLGGIELLSNSSWYQSSAHIYRDFDGTAEGEVYGVCAVGLNCAVPGSLFPPVVRLQRVNIVQYHPMAAREIEQEIRLRSKGDDRFTWSAGATLFWTRQGQRTNFAYGAERGLLTATERFTSLVLANPQRVGQLAAINSALATDPNAVQIVQNDAAENRRTIAAFAVGDFKFASGWRLHGEVRTSWERQVLDSRISNFLPSFGNELGSKHFFDLTPRVSIDYQPAAGWLAYASYARGSRSGGINAVAGLQPSEQSFEPETNWTAELGAKFSGAGALRSAGLAFYHIDWRNTQILGFATTPGVSALITRNTKGIETWGMDLTANVQAQPWVRLDLAVSYVHARFKSGSEDPGSSAFCGLGPKVTTSSFCTIRTSEINPGQLVPDISGNVVPHTPEISGAAAVTIAPQADAFHGLQLRLGLTYQGNSYERAVNGLSYGERTLLDARLTLPLGRFALELWGINLTDNRYVRIAVGRQPQFYTSIPRPFDLILGEGRRIGLTISFSN